MRRRGRQPLVVSPGVLPLVHHRPVHSLIHSGRVIRLLVRCVVFLAECWGAIGPALKVKGGVDAAVDFDSISPEEGNSNQSQRSHDRNEQSASPIGKLREKQEGYADCTTCPPDATLDRVWGQCRRLPQGERAEKRPGPNCDQRGVTKDALHATPLYFVCKFHICMSATNSSRRRPSRTPGRTASRFHLRCPRRRVLRESWQR